MTDKKIKNKMTPQKKYYGIIKTIINACETKGWNAYPENKDKDYQVGTISISKRYAAYEEVTGFIEFTIADEHIKYSIQKTSFYGYGLDSLLEVISIKLQKDGWARSKNETKPEKKETSEAVTEPLTTLSTILHNFDRAVRQIRRRYNDRGTIEIKDEYDVQDLLHTILRAVFDDIRPEEYTPSYAGGSSRIDLLLKKEKTLVEVKFASSKLKEKEIGEQLIIDIKKYQTHPDCQNIYCLVYDPSGIIRNPIGLERDLSGIQDKIGVKVLVVPQ